MQGTSKRAGFRTMCTGTLVDPGVWLPCGGNDLLTLSPPPKSSILKGPLSPNFLPVAHCHGELCQERGQGMGRVASCLLHSRSAEDGYLPLPKREAVSRHALPTSLCLELALSPPQSVLEDQCPAATKDWLLWYLQAPWSFREKFLSCTLQTISLECVHSLLQGRFQTRPRHLGEPM